MGDWPKYRQTTFAADDRTVGTTEASWFVTVTANASANTKGTYTQIVASTPTDICGLLVNIGLGATGRGYLMDIAIGAGGSEQVVIPNMPLQQFRSTGNPDMVFFIPIKIPKGSRIAVRTQSSTGGSTFGCAMQLVGQDWNGFRAPSRWIDQGADTANSSGTSCSTSPSGTTTQIVASASFAFNWVFLASPLNAGSDDYVVSWLVGTTEVIAAIRNSGQTGALPILLPWTIPGGTQVQVKIRSVNSTTVRSMFLGGG